MLARISKALKMPWATVTAALCGMYVGKEKPKPLGGKYVPLGRAKNQPAVRLPATMYHSVPLASSYRRDTHESSNSSAYDSNSLVTGLVLGELLSGSSDSYASTDYSSSSSSSDSFSGGGGDFGGAGSSDSY